jgi:glycosyltransferase involved in cell wall biosynthesis
MRRHLEALAGSLPRRGFQVAAALPPGVHLEAPIERFDLMLGDRPRPASDLGCLHDLRRFAQGWRPDLVHAHGVKAALLTLSAFRRSQPPVLVTFHNLWHGGPLTLPLRIVSLRAVAAIAVSDAVRACLAEHGVRPRKLVVIRNGLDLSSFQPASASSPDRPFTVAFVGRLTEEKGVNVLLQAVSLIPESTGIRVRVAGEGPLRASVEAVAARCGRLEYLGHQTDVLPVYHSAGAVVIPSLSEGHPLAALEAMACSLPVVASRIGGLPETVINEETGLLVPAGDARALAGALHRLEGDPFLRRSMGSAGRARVEAEFTVDRMLDQISAVYRQALGGS